MISCEHCKRVIDENDEHYCKICFLGGCSCCLEKINNNYYHKDCLTTENMEKIDNEK